MLIEWTPLKANNTLTLVLCTYAFFKDFEKVRDKS